MSDQTFATSVIHPAEGPAVRTIGPEDLRAALVAGFNDFWAVPTHVVFLAIIYPVLGFILTRVTMGEDLLPLVYPLIAGFALIGPFAALGLYEMSRRREQGATPTWQDALRVAHSPARGSIAALGLLQVAIFVAWIATANAIYAGLFGPEHPASAGDFLRDVLTTSNGWALILVGNAVGFVFAAVAFTVSVVSFPLLLDRNVSAATALLTSVRAVRRNPGTMAIWAAILAAALLLGSLPAFIGLAVVMPVLGHASWHLYRAVVAR